MSARSRLFALSAPAFARKAALRSLARLTARAFGADYPRGRGLSPAASLERYASFSAGQVEALLRNGASTAPVERELFSGAEEFGRRLRAWLGIRSARDAMPVARALYRMIGIDFEGSATGGFTIRRCFFSSHYSPGACRVISSLDAGLIAGLAGGGRMVFARRMTEGAAFCAGVVE